MNILSSYQNHFLENYSNYPHGLYITLILARWIESEAIFRTEGSGEPLSKEFVHAGLNGGEPIQRVVISKRKQTAVERRTGRELLRRHELLYSTKDGICALNRNNPCEKCMDCMIYGYAAGGGGAQKARVITDDAFSLHPTHQILGTKQFNALYDNSTMRDPEDLKKASTSIGTDEYVKPEAIFLDMETLKDLTPGEFQYVLGNVLRSSRYGAISSRIGKVQNELLGIVFSDCELFSNLELTQATYDLLPKQGDEPQFPLSKEEVHTAVYQASSQLIGRIIGQTTVLTSDEVTKLVSELRDLYGDETAVTNLLQQTSNIYGWK